MNLFRNRFVYAWVLIMGFSLFENTALAQNIPKPVEGSWVVRDFKFSTGETLPELKLSYVTIG
jgi:homoserine O-acetyltransferase/O-succinyltransferase